MKTVLYTISENASVYDAASQMKKKKVSGLLVTNASGTIYAVVTDADLVRRAIAGKKMNARLKEVASKPLIGVNVDADISEAARIMGERNVKRLVVFKQKKVVGIISAKDVIRISPSLYDLVAEKQRITQR